MKSILIFIFGFIAGVFATIFFVFLIGLGIKAKDNEVERKVVQKIEVKGKIIVNDTLPEMVKIKNRLGLRNRFC